MDLTDEYTESKYWTKKLSDKIEWRDEFFKFHKELLPPILKKEIEQKEAQSPTKVSMQKSKEALEGNPALKFMLPKQSREQMIHDTQRSSAQKVNKSEEEQKDELMREKYDISPELYQRFYNMNNEQKMDQYNRMGIPTIKRKKLHFKSIEFFNVCILKYFSSVVKRTLIEEDEEYGGLRDVFQKFMQTIHQRIEEDPDLAIEDPVMPEDIE